MSNAPVDPERWRQRLAELAERHRVPGAALGVLRIAATGGPAEDERLVVGAGTRSLVTGDPVGEHALFQIGSVTKALTATALVRLADAGALDLDRPAVERLDGLRLGDPTVAARVTPRELLGHVSGIDGDVFTDTGRGDDCLQRYVAGLAEVDQTHPLGELWSYCNSGYMLAGRIAETVTGRCFDEAIEELLLVPAGMTRTVFLPERALMLEPTLGHVPGPDGAVGPAGRWGIPRSNAPAGGAAATAGDLLAFARLHLTDGCGPQGERLLSAETVAAMQQPVAAGGAPTGWGTGWMLDRWDSHRVVGHDGDAPGAHAALRLLPDDGLAVVVLTNADGRLARGLVRELLAELLPELDGIAPPPAPVPPVAPADVDVAPWLGRYERARWRTDVVHDGGQLRLRRTVSAPMAGLDAVTTEEWELVPIDERAALTRPPGMDTWLPVAFGRLDDGTDYVHYAGRATRRLAA